MRRMLLAGVVAICASTQALAQATPMMTPQQRTAIKEYVVKERIAPVTLTEKFSVGARLPADVELRTVPADWGSSVTNYRYVYSDDRVYFVEPSSREVIHIID